MRRTLLIVAIMFQVMVLVFMAGKREYIAATGAVVYLRTAPFDPRDLFRGDYVRLRYEASTVPLSRASADIAEQAKKYASGAVVYAALSVGEGNLAEVTGLSTAQPASGVFVKGRLARPWQVGIDVPGTAAVEYGIEAYYVQEGQGLEIEKLQGAGNAIQTPLEMEIAVGGDGTALIRGHRWSPISIGLAVVEQPRQGDPTGRKSARLRLTLKNTSQKPLALVNLPSFCSLYLEPVTPDRNVRAQDLPVCRGFTLTENDVLVLRPDDAGFYDIDLADPRWHVLRDSIRIETGVLPLSERFRIIYRPPSRETTAFLKDAAIIWHGHLPSRAFHGSGNID